MLIPRIILLNSLHAPLSPQTYSTCSQGTLPIVNLLLNDNFTRH